MTAVIWRRPLLLSLQQTLAAYLYILLNCLNWDWHINLIRHSLSSTFFRFLRYRNCSTVTQTTTITNLFTNLRRITCWLVWTYMYCTVFDGLQVCASMIHIYIYIYIYISKSPPTLNELKYVPLSFNIKFYIFSKE